MFLPDSSMKIQKPQFWKENISSALKELTREFGDVSGSLGARCDVIGGRDESAVGVLRQGSTRVFAAHSNGSISLAWLHVRRELLLALTSLVRVSL